MINKKMIIVIAIFIATGFLVFSFAATPQGETIDNNGGSTNSNTNNDNKNNTSSNIKDKEKDKDNKKDNDIVATPIGSQDNQNNGQNTILDNNGGTNTGNNANTGNSGNTGDNKPTEPEKPSKPETPTEPENPSKPETPTEPEKPSKPETPTEPENPSKPETPTEPENPTKPTEPDINVDKLTGSSVFVSDNNSNLKPSINDNVVTYTGTIDISDVDDFGIYMTNIVVKAPYAYSQKVLKNATIKTPYGETYGSEVLQYDADGYAYFEFSQGFFSDNSVIVNVTVNWGVGEDIVYTLKSNINVVD